MSVHATGPRGQSKRGRIVMLVDNAVVGDSRVQKAASSAAKSGWEVTLLGVFDQNAREAWRIGDAEVRLLRVAKRLGNPWQHRRSIFFPLAYPPGRVQAYRFQRLAAWRTHLGIKKDQLRLESQRLGNTFSQFLKRSQIAISGFALEMATLWARLRGSQLTRLQKHRADPKAIGTRMSIWFWRALLGDGCWRKLDPGLWDYELAFGPVIDELQPDIIHAHDFRMIGVGARAAVRARARGRQVKLLYDAHEFVPGIVGRASDPRWLPAQIAYERDFLKYADAVVTVSDDLADLLKQTHRLRERPTVVLNAPMTDEFDGDGPVPDVRSLCGLDADSRLIVYSGGVNPHRGLDTVVNALPALPDVHLALVSLNGTTISRPTQDLLRLAEDLGVRDRVHLLPYVPHWQVARFLSSADLGVNAMQHLQNHEIALPNKFFEYSHARIPVITSDVRTAARTVRETGQGEVFRSGDVEDFVRAVKMVLNDPQRYRAAYERSGLLATWTWEAQAEILDELYKRLLSDQATTSSGGHPTRNSQRG